MALGKRSTNRFPERFGSSIKYVALTVAEVIVALLGYEQGDNLQEKGKRTAGWLARVGIYVIADNWINVLHVSLGAALKWWGFSLLEMFGVIWIFDFIVAGAFVLIFELTGRDLSLGIDLRRAADAIHGKSRFLGALVAFWNILLSIIWFGPERVITYYRSEIGTQLRLVALLLSLTAVQALLWASLYSFAYDFVVTHL